MKHLAIILALLATPAMACQQPANVCDESPDRAAPVDRDNPFDTAPDKPTPEPEPPLDNGR